MRQHAAAGLEMALQAHLHLPLGTEPRRIDYCAADLLARGAGCSRDGDMARARSVASLAIDPLRERNHVSRLGPGFTLAGGDARVRVMAEHAFVMDRARRSLIIQAVITGIHRPVAALFRIPAERQLLQRIP